MREEEPHAPLPHPRSAAPRLFPVGWPLLAVVLGASMACGPEAAEGPQDAGQSAPRPSFGDGSDEGAGFALTDVRTVAIEMDPADLEALRHQTRTLDEVYGAEGPGCFGGPAPSPYTYFDADVTLDGVRYDGAAVRKRGFQGSLSTTKPALHVKLDTGEAERRFAGQKKVVLANSIQDPSYLRLCLAYATFRRAGVPAPRCQLATVRLNGEPQGVYVHVERIDKPFLRQWFDDEDGELYEGTLADLAPDWVENYERQSSQGPGSPEHLAALLTALQLAEERAQDGGDVLEVLDEVIDLDAFFRFWVVESFVIDVDGYPAAANNYYLYFDPADGRAHFLPWGADLTFSSGGPIDPASFPAVIARTRLPRVLLSDEEGRVRYEEAMRTFLDEVWDPEVALAEAATVGDALAGALPSGERAAAAAERDAVEALLSGRADVVRARLAEGLPHGALPLSLPCLDDSDPGRP